ncbi:MAG: ArsR family transcriptional regulator [Rickettsiales bacterium]|jgi:Lrp/AsnC family transcriptional regulator|nr:ArsR family transcriptional regulator [Rickettsiales bacterium]
MDDFDKRILSCLQKDASLPLTEIAERVGLSATPCWRRIQNLEKVGVIEGRVALLDPAKLNVGVTVFVALKTNEHSQDWLEKFARYVDTIDEVVEFYRMSGDVDYMLRVVVPDIAAYDKVYKRLITIGGLSDVSSAFAMERIKYTTELPLDYSDQR